MMLEVGSTIGIIGGGQLAKMLSVAATRLGFRVVIYSDRRDCPAAQSCSELVIADYDDDTEAARFIGMCDVITYEFENIPVSFCKYAEEKGRLYPGSAALRAAQHRATEKNFVTSLGVNLPSFAEIDSGEALYAFLLQHPEGCIVKTSVNGYDGKGQVRVTPGTSKKECTDIIASFHGAEILCEELVPFAAETSVGIARNIAGDVSFFPSSENIHEGGILRSAAVPSSFSDETIANARNAAERIAVACDYVGVMAAEFFVLENGEVLFNEFAPRPHNSLHWSIEACVTCQFEQHIRAIVGWPFGSTALRGSARTENLIGTDVERLHDYLRCPNTKIHLYGKKETLPGRKMGHVTILNAFI